LGKIRAQEVVPKSTEIHRESTKNFAVGFTTSTVN